MQDLFKAATALDEVDDGIHSCLPADSRASDYDDKARAYDLVVGNRFYNRLVWGNWPSRYRAFCEEALASADGPYLDAGCGSLVFTADVYARTDARPIVLLDRSLGMLKRGRDRIRQRLGRVPDHIRFLQADIFDLPFHDGAFGVVASYGVLHVFAEPAGMLAELGRVRRPGGSGYISSLVGNTALGRRYLALLARAGEVGVCHTTASLAATLASTGFDYRVDAVGNMAYLRSA